MPFTPVHGEYGLYKSANLAGVSTSSQNYRWWPSGPTVYDRTYERTGGRQYGHFLYIDASDESRQIAAADFKANLCSGAKLIFSGAVANYTSGKTQPQVMFRLYGIIRDDEEKIMDQRLITSFSSGDFDTNTDTYGMGTWMQVYSKLVLPRNSGAENYSDFRIVMDNMCMNTNGADYLIDDLRLYIQPAKVDVVQNKPLCPSESGYRSTPKSITLKLRANYDNMLAMVGNGQGSVFYRICDEQGQPVTTIDYDGDGQPDEYGRAEIPASYDATRTLPAYAADGSTTTPMFENDAQNDVLIVMANRNFDLQQGKNYYVSVAYPDEDDSTKPGTWGVPSNVCSTYSEMFQIVQQNVLITDANGNVVTNIRVSCDANRTPDVNITGKLETADIVNGGKVTLGNVRFDWFLSKPNEENLFAKTDGLQEALARYRAAYPTATTLADEYQQTDAEGYALLKKYIDEGQLVIAASNDMSSHKFGEGMMGLYKIAAIPIATSVTEGRTTYEICPDPMYFALRIVEDGPKLTLGFGDVAYPTDERAVRIGLPQIRAIMAKGKTLVLPVKSLDSSQKIAFENNSDVFVSDTNDPTFDNTHQIVGRIQNDGLQAGDSQLAMVFDDNAATTLREGYWYELNFSYRQQQVGTEAVVSCPGETFITFKIVPEYTTWNSSQDNKLNANWNNDRNWLRSTAAELYKTDYTDYDTGRTSAYTPMKFTKATIADQTGRVYPDLGNIVYRTTNQIATKLTNAKGEEATPNIAYDMMARWNYDTDDHSDTGDGTFTCEKFEGNVCSEIYLKPHAELLDPCYLSYRRAYVEKELTTNQWYIASSPLRATYAGDMYVPATSGRQQTEAFSPITFDPTAYSRTQRPIYQRTWDEHAQQTAGPDTFYEGYGYNDGSLRIDTISDASLNIESLYWSHVYNKVDEAYADGHGFSIRAGDRYYPQNGPETWLVRLPKDDTSYAYYSADGTPSAITSEVNKDEAGRMIVEPSNDENAYSAVRQPLRHNVHSTDRYYLVGNPYTASLSALQFVKGNPSFAQKIWTLEAGRMEAHILPDDAATSERYKDVTIEPMQAFFVKLKDGADAPDCAYFTTAMTVDRWVTGGSSAQQQDATLTITAGKEGRQSTARVVVNDDCSPNFDDNEDVEMLDNSDLDDIPQAYTVAESQTTSLNATNDIGWLPMGITAKDTEIVDVRFGRNGKLRGDLYLFDAQTRQFAPIADGTTLRLQAGCHGRYYITRHASLPSGGTTTGVVKCYASENGSITICSPTAGIGRIEVYDLSGMMVLTAQGGQKAESTISVGRPGIYAIKVQATDGMHTFKVSVR